MFEWIVSHGSMEEAHAKRDPGHLQWLWDIADHSEVCMAADGLTAESEALGTRLDEAKFGYFSKADRRLLREAIVLRCDAFLTVCVGFNSRIRDEPYIGGADPGPAGLVDT